MALAAAGLALAGSVDGRQIVAHPHGERGATRNVLVVGSIHGDETEGERVVERLAGARLQRRLGDGVRLWLIESVNPDGVAAATRGNARGVDLNRNFPWNWEAIPESSGYYSGPRPASEPETRGVARFLRRVDPDVTIYYHQPFGRTLIPCDRRGRDVALEYAELSGLSADDCFPSPPGSATGFQGGRLKQRAFVVEFPAGELSRAEVRRHTRAVLEIAERGRSRSARAAAAEAPYSLRDDASRAGLGFGAAAQSEHLDDAGFAQLLGRHINLLVFENEAKWNVLHPAPDRYDFSEADRLARFAVAHGMRMRGHTLIWHAENPEWLKALSPTRDAAKALLRDHIFTVVGHFRRKFPGLITQWDVVNEAIDNDATRRRNIWQRWIGDDYVALAFKWARKAAGPGVDLYLNDYFDTGMMAGAELIPEFDDGDAVPSTTTGATGPLGCDAVAKCVATRELVDSLLAAGVPIDGVGFQGHMADVVPSDFRALTSWVGERGLDWALTEVDVPMPAGTGPLGAARQAGAFATAADACIDDPACETIVTWGLSDRYTWWKGLLGGVLPDALPFDEALAPKAAADALHETFAAAPAAPCHRGSAVRIRIAGRAERVRRVTVRLDGVVAERLRGPRRAVRVSLRDVLTPTVEVSVRARLRDGRSVVRSRDVRLCV